MIANHPIESHLRSHRISLRQIPFITLLISLAVVAIHSRPDLSSILAFERGAISAGQWWRWITGHLTHWSWNHLGWDLLVFTVLGGWCEFRSRKGFVTTLAASAAAISTAVWWLMPNLTTYCGLSGIDSALFGWLLATHLRSNAKIQRNQRMHQLVLMTAAGFIAKLIYETLTGGAVFMNTTGPIVTVPLAHLAGFLTGLAMGLIPRPLMSSSNMKDITPANIPALQSEAVQIQPH